MIRIYSHHLQKIGIFRAQSQIFEKIMIHTYPSLIKSDKLSEKNIFV